MNFTLDLIFWYLRTEGTVNKYWKWKTSKMFFLWSWCSASWNTLFIIVIGKNKRFFICGCFCISNLYNLALIILYEWGLNCEIFLLYRMYTIYYYLLLGWRGIIAFQWLWILSCQVAHYSVEYRWLCICIEFLDLYYLLCVGLHN